MRTSRSISRLGAALFAAVATLALSGGLALAHPESEGDHPAGCVVTAEPGTVSVGGQFTVSGNFGGASIFVVPGTEPRVPEGAQPDATTPEGDSFSVTFTATGSPGVISVVASIPETECGDVDQVTVTGTLPNTASKGQADELAAIAGILLLGAALVTTRGRLAARRA